MKFTGLPDMEIIMKWIKDGNLKCKINEKEEYFIDKTSRPGMIKYLKSS